MRIKIEWIVLAVAFSGIFPLSGTTQPEHGIDLPSWSVPGGNPEFGPQAIVKYGCFACHVIPGIRRANGRVGPKLEDIKEQIYVGGVLENSPENMMEWIRHPRRHSPETAMPDLDVSDRDSRDIAAYLFEEQ
jgi:cytochrome c